MQDFSRGWHIETDGTVEKSCQYLLQGLVQCSVYDILACTEVSFLIVTIKRLTLI